MKSQDMLLELREISRSLQHAREYIQSGMGKNSPFLRDETERINQLVQQLEKEFDLYRRQHPVILETLKT